MRGITASAIWRPRSDFGRFVQVRITPAVRESVEQACQMIESSAKSYCPVDTGALRDSITSNVEELEKTIRGEVAPHMHYAAYVEYGTGIRGAGSPEAGPGPYNMNWPGMVPQPYMRPAFDEHREKIDEVFRHNIGVALA